MITREIIATDDTAAASLLPFARKEFAKLRERRIAHKLPLLKRNFHINGLTVLLYCGQHIERITILGSYTYHMLFSSPESVTNIHTYNYLSDVLRAAVSVPANVADPIHAFANTHCHLGDTQDIFLSSGWKTAALIDATNYGHIATSPQYEVELLRSNNAFILRTFDGTAPVATSIDPVLPISGNYLNLFGVTHYPQTPDWNLWQGLSLSHISPANADAGEVWVWIPSFFTVEPATLLGLAPGWYYGQTPNSDYGIERSLTSAKVSFCGLIETRDTTTPRTTGWCECVTEVDGVQTGDINFFFVDALPFVGNSTAYREIAYSSRYAATMTIGASLDGFAKTFSLQTTNPGEKPEIKAWNFAAWTNSSLENQETSAVCALVIENKKLRAYKWKGYLQQFFTTEKYHSYSVSDNGSMVAIFEGDEFIESVSVFDLYGTRESRKEPAEYLQGGFTTLQTQSDVTQISAMSACFIPRREKDFTPSVPLFTLDGIEVKSIVSGGRDFMSSLSTLVFVKNGQGALTISKLSCTNGLDAEFGVSIDPCFSSIVYMDDPQVVSVTDKLISTWNVGGVIKGHVRGLFTGNHPDMRFAGITEGNPIAVATLPPTIDIVKATDGTFSIYKAVGEVKFESCLYQDDSGAIRTTAECLADIRCSGGTLTYSVSSSCGQYGQMQETFPPPAGQLTIEGPDAVTEGAIYVASGGVPPYAWSISCGTIDDGVVVSLSGCCGAGSITVFDSCGGSAALSVRFPVGGWVYKGQTIVCYGAYSETGMWSEPPPSGTVHEATGCVSTWVSGGPQSHTTGSLRVEYYGELNSLYGDPFPSCPQESYDCPVDLVHCLGPGYTDGCGLYCWMAGAYRTWMWECP